MAYKWIEGWRYREANIPLDYTETDLGTGSVAVAELAARRTGCYAVTLTNYALTRAVSFSGYEVIVGAAVKWTSGAIDLFQVKEGATVHLTVQIDAGGILRLFRGDSGGTELDNGSTLTPGTIYYIELVATIADAASGLASVFLDDVEDLTDATTDTKNGGSTFPDSVRIAGGSGGVTLADFYIIDPADTAGATAKKGSGARVDCRIPIGTGAQTDCTANTGSNYAAVDDDGYDSDTTYVSTQTAGARDVYIVDQMTHAPSIVDAIQINVVAKKSDSGARSLKVASRTSDGVVTASSATALTTSYAAMEMIVEDGGAKDDGGTWTQAGFNVRQFGFEVV